MTPLCILNLNRLCGRMKSAYPTMVGYFMTGKENEFMPKDPVCGMDVKEDKAKATSVHRGKSYFFCAEACKKKFDQTPEKYVVKSSGCCH